MTGLGYTSTALKTQWLVCVAGWGYTDTVLKTQWLMCVWQGGVHRSSSQHPCLVCVSQWGYTNTVLKTQWLVCVAGWGYIDTVLKTQWQVFVWYIWVKHSSEDSVTGVWGRVGLHRHSTHWQVCISSAWCVCGRVGYTDSSQDSETGVCVWQSRVHRQFSRPRDWCMCVAGWGYTDSSQDPVTGVCVAE